MGVEDVGVIGAVHHLTAGFVLSVAAAVRALGLGSVAIRSHPITGITHSVFHLIPLKKMTAAGKCTQTQNEKVGRNNGW